MIYAIIVLSILLIISLVYVFRFALTILRVQDAIEECLDTLDERYAAVYEILQTPLYYDSPEVRSVYDNLKASQEAILYVANVLVKQEEQLDGGKEEEED